MRKRDKYTKEEKKANVTSSKVVNKSESVNNSVNNLKKFNYPLQRLGMEQLHRCNDIAITHNRKSFKDVMELLFFCYDILMEVSDRTEIPLHRIQEIIQQIPIPEKRQRIMLTYKYIRDLEDVGITEETRKLLKNLLDITMIKEDSEWLRQALVLKNGHSFQSKEVDG